MIKLTWIEVTVDNKLVVKNKEFESKLECNKFYSSLKNKNNFYMKVGCSIRLTK